MLVLPCNSIKARTNDGDDTYKGWKKEGRGVSELAPAHQPAYLQTAKSCTSTDIEKIKHKALQQ